MKQMIKTGLVVAAVALFTVPSAFAQKEKEKSKEKNDDGMQQIIITRKGDAAGKTIIEVDGDKVKVNGKDVTDSKDGDVSVHVNKFKSFKNLSGFTPGAGAWSYNFNDNGRSFFSVDSNRAMLGVVTDEDDKGAKITSITKESGAEKAGLQKGDVITKIDNKKVEDAEDVSEAVRAHKPGDKISITYLRDGKEQKATAELGRWQGIRMNAMTMPKVRGNADVYRELIAPEVNAPIFDGQGFVFNTNRPKLGLSVQDTEDGKGVKVLEADKDGTGAKAGIQKDDIITSIDDKEVNSTDEIARLMRQKANNPSVRFQVLRNGKSQTIEVKVPRKLKTADL
jgi:serine protease Do